MYVIQCNGDFMKKGLILVNTGNGKGKTTSALGSAIRAAGNGLRVCVIQFMKGAIQSGERETIKLLPNIEIHAMGTGFSWTKDSWDEDKALARNAWEKSKEAIHSGRFDLVVLDEINYVLDYDLLALQDVIYSLRNKPEHVCIFLTGRKAKQEIIELADMVTEMKEIKHHFNSGIKAQKGIEF
jgi:cob(I)alamin adenosyltransferase